MAFVVLKTIAKFFGGKPALLRLRTKWNTLLHKARDESLDLGEVFDALVEKCRLKEDGLRELEGAVRVLGERYREEMEVGFENENVYCGEMRFIYETWNCRESE